MRWWLVAVVAVGCKGDAPPVARDQPVTAAASDASVTGGPRMLALARGTTVELVAIGSDAKLAATVALPSAVHGIVWVDRDPVALLVAQQYGDFLGDAKLDGTVGTITPKGFQPLPALPTSSWTIVPTQRGSTRFERPYWTIEESPSGEAWLGRCEWGGLEDGGHCDDWVWARLGGAFALTSRKEPPVRKPRPWPTVAAAPDIALSFAPKPGSTDHSIMTCRAGSASTTFPSEDDGWADRASLRWISTNPPVFTIDQNVPGADSWLTSTAVFEGCTPAPAYAHGVSGVAGPDDMLLVYAGSAGSLRRGGQQLLAIGGADDAAFAPDGPRAPATDAFSVLERQLGGDTSMIAPDALVPGSVPIPKVATARIESFSAEDAGDATWLAAELRLDGRTFARSS